MIVCLIFKCSFFVLTSHMHPPQSTEDVVEVIKLANQYRMPVVPYSGGTALEGHCTAPYGGICLDLSRMDKIHIIREKDSDAVCGPGVVWDELNAELVDRGLSLFFPLDPAPGATLGGMLNTGCSGESHADHSPQLGYDKHRRDMTLIDQATQERTPCDMEPPEVNGF